MHKSSKDGDRDPAGSNVARFPVNTGAGSGEVDAVGVLDSRLLPDREFIGQWDAVIVETAQKDRLLCAGHPELHAQG